MKHFLEREIVVVAVAGIDRAHRKGYMMVYTRNELLKSAQITYSRLTNLAKPLSEQVH